MLKYAKKRSLNTQMWSCLHTFVSASATWRSTIRTAVSLWRCGTGTWPVAMTSWDRFHLGSRSSRSKAWMDGEINGWMDGWVEMCKAAQVEEKRQWRWPCSLLNCWRNTLASAKTPLLYLSALPPFLLFSSYISLSSPLFLLMVLCQGF